MAELTAPAGREGLGTALLWAGWAAFTAWCLSGVPPPVDLPGHGAQLETLAALVRGDALVGAYFQPVFSVGYGLPHWLFLPLALAVDGAFAARAALWVALQLHFAAALVLARTFAAPRWVLVPALPLAFSMSYWYGLLPGVFAQPLILFALATLVWGARTPAAGWKPLVVLNLLSAAAMLCHLLAFALLPLCLGAAALASPQRRAALRLCAGGLCLPAAFALPRLLALGTRAVTSGDWPPTEYALAAHFNWAFKHFRPEGHLAALGPVLTLGALLAWSAWRRRASPQPLAAFLAAAAAYVAAPKTLSGIFLVPMRIPAVAGAVGLLATDLATVPRWLRAGVLALSVASLFETARFHHQFAGDTRGLFELVRRHPSPGLHGFYSLAGHRLRGSVPVYLEHLGEWWTAAQGGVGHNLFAHYDHHPVQYRPGKRLPINLEDATVEERARFERVLVYGAGALPQPFDAWRQVDAQGAFRILENPAAGLPGRAP